MWVKTSVDLSGYNPNTIGYDLGVDNGFELLVNGNPVTSNNAEGYTYRWEYSGSISPGFLVPGVNDILVKLEDHGGLTAFDMQITGDAVPDGGTTVALLGLSLSGLAFLRRKLD
jgi:hypothetical protein